jgi:acyl dehydratase
MTELTLAPRTFRVTRASLVRYAGASGDFNPIHYSERHAQAIGFSDVTAHGLLTLGVVLRAVTDWLGDPALVRSYSARFIRPVLVPDTDDGAELRVTGQVVAQGEQAWTVALDVTSGGTPVLAKVTVEVEPPR